MATDTDKDNFIIGECKFKNSAFDLSDLNGTLAKFKPKKSTANVYYFLFSKSGFSDEVKRKTNENGIKLISIDEMM